MTIEELGDQHEAELDKLTEGHISDRIRNAHALRKEATYAVPVDRFPPRPLPRP